jgi:hypothetical protein
MYFSRHLKEMYLLSSSVTHMTLRGWVTYPGSHNQEVKSQDLNSYLSDDRTRKLLHLQAHGEASMTKHIKIVWNPVSN